LRCGLTSAVEDGGRGKSRRQGANVNQLLRRLWQEQEAQDLTEYALLLVLIALAAVASVKRLSTSIKDVFNNAATDLASDTAGGGRGYGS
jgi:Flp pilus assembly pilin Flp